MREGRGSFEMRARTSVTLLAVLALGLAASSTAQEPEESEPLRTVRAVMQERPGGPTEEVDVGIHPVPVDPPSVPASQAELPGDDLVLGVVADGQAMAYPIRYLALYGVVNDHVGSTGLAPTW